MYDQNDEELRLAIELSNKEYLIMEERLNKERELERKVEYELKKSNRINSLQNFCKRIKSLFFTENDILLKKYIEEVLDQYFELKIDYIIVDNKTMYNQLYKIIDSYYLEPFEKNYKRTAISKEENDILRTIFL